MLSASKKVNYNFYPFLKKNEKVIHYIKKDNYRLRALKPKEFINSLNIKLTRSHLNESIHYHGSSIDPIYYERRFLQLTYDGFKVHRVNGIIPIENIQILEDNCTKFVSLKDNDPTIIRHKPEKIIDMILVYSKQIGPLEYMRIRWEGLNEDNDTWIHVEDIDKIPNYSQYLLNEFYILTVNSLHYADRIINVDPKITNINHTEENIYRSISTLQNLIKINDEKCKRKDFKNKPLPWDFILNNDFTDSDYESSDESSESDDSQSENEINEHDLTNESNNSKKDKNSTKKNKTINYYEQTNSEFFQTYRIADTRIAENEYYNKDHERICENIKRYQALAKNKNNGTNSSQQPKCFDHVRVRKTLSFDSDKSSDSDNHSHSSEECFIRRKVPNIITSKEMNLWKNYNDVIQQSPPSHVSNRRTENIIRSKNENEQKKFGGNNRSRYYDSSKYSPRRSDSINDYNSECINRRKGQEHQTFDSQHAPRYFETGRSKHVYSNHINHSNDHMNTERNGQMYQKFYNHNKSRHYGNYENRKYRSVNSNHTSYFNDNQDRPRNYQVHRKFENHNNFKDYKDSNYRPFHSSRSYHRNNNMYRPRNYNFYQNFNNSNRFKRYETERFSPVNLDSSDSDEPNESNEPNDSDDSGYLPNVSDGSNSCKSSTSSSGSSRKTGSSESPESSESYDSQNSPNLSGSPFHHSNNNNNSNTSNKRKTISNLPAYDLETESRKKRQKQKNSTILSAPILNCDFKINSIITNKYKRKIQIDSSDSSDQKTTYNNNNNKNADRIFKIIKLFS